MKVALVVVASIGCGRIGFDGVANHSDGGVDGAMTVSSLPMPSGGEIVDLAVAASGDWYATGRGLRTFRSSDQGLSWTSCALLPDRATSVAVPPGSDTVLVSTASDVMTSTDRCATWQSTGHAGAYVFRVESDASGTHAMSTSGLRKFLGGAWVNVPTPITGQSGRSYATTTTRRFYGTTGGLAVSTDGVAWSSASTLAGRTIHRIATAGNKSYAISDKTGGVFCSDDTGTAWTLCHSVNTGEAIAVDPANPNFVVAAEYDELVVTTDGFATAASRGWRKGEMDQQRVKDLMYTPSGVLIAAGDRGVFTASDNTLDWKLRSTGINAWRINAIARSGSDIYLATTGGVLYSGNTDPFVVRTNGVTLNTRIGDIAITPNGGVLSVGRWISYSTDHGATWSQNYLTPAADGFLAWAIAMHGSRAIVGTYGRLVVADPPYTTWTPHAIGGANRNVYQIVLAPPSTLWIATSSGLWTSTDDGTTTTATTLLTNEVHALAQLDDGRMLAGTNDGLWIGNATNTAFTQTLAGTDINGVGASGDLVVIATADGISISRDRGGSFTPVAVPPTAFTAVLIDPTTLDIAVGTDGDGVALVRVAN